MIFLSCTYNPALSCIKVWDVGYANSNYQKDPQAIFSLNCATAITEPSNSKIKVYPNPVNQLLTIETDENVEPQLFDINGKALNLSFQNQSIDMSGLENGIYLLQLKMGNRIEKQKICKQ